MDLAKLIASARTSAWKRFVLNHLLGWKIPFNRPHGFRVIPIQGGIRVRIPYWPVNRNHINGIHACALATGAELCSGLSLLEHLDAKRYRLIMASLHMDYFKQAKRTTFAESKPPRDAIKVVIEGLKREESVRYQSTIELHDDQGLHVATGTVEWQVKEWGRVRMKA